jgi:FkbM family methyltransferase
MLFDLGANVGDWSLAALEALPQAEVHAFEIAPATAEELKNNLAAYAGRAKVIPKGMGMKEGGIKLYFTPESTTAASMIPGVVEFSAGEHHIHTVQEIIAEITTGDRYVTDNKIEQVDFLKIDVEGAEWTCCKGFAMLSRRRRSRWSSSNMGRSISRPASIWRITGTFSPAEVLWSASCFPRAWRSKIST